MNVSNAEMEVVHSKWTLSISLARASPTAVIRTTDQAEHLVDDATRPPQTVLDALVAAVQRASAYDANDQTAPAALLWPDKERLWQPLLPQLRERLPLLTFGDYEPATRTGPAYWLRCHIAGTLADTALPAGAVPIVYLPGISRADLRAVEKCPRPLQPLVELGYRGAVWTHDNGRDWTPYAFLRTPAPNGLGLDLAGDLATREALTRALAKLANQPLSRLRNEGRLSFGFFNDLLAPDPVRGVLDWLHQPDAFRAQLGDDEWQAFRARCTQQYGFDPATSTAIDVARLLGTHTFTQPWNRVWDRFREAPTRFSGVIEWLERAQPSPNKLTPMFDQAVWPGINAAQETDLRDALSALAQRSPAEAREQLIALDEQHGGRRAWLWAELGRAPLARALEHLATLARYTAEPLAGPSLPAIVDRYVDGGWRVDAAALDALAQVSQTGDVAAVHDAVRTVYMPWLDATARAFQHAAHNDRYLCGPPVLAETGDCLLFSDGLRFDIAHRIAGRLQARGLATGVRPRLTALPSITATAKPAVSPAAPNITGGPELAPTERRAGGDRGARVDIAVLRRLLGRDGYQVLTAGETGNPAGVGWTEAGDIDHFAHPYGATLARELDGKLREIEERIEALLAAGWRRVVVVTDHGWLLLPGGLPKADLDIAQTVVRKGRCARLRDGAQTGYVCLPWHWDSSVQIAFATGIDCFEQGKEYEHGGLSPQECVTPVLTVSHAHATSAHRAAIDSVAWRQARGVLHTTGAEGLRLDLRTSAGDPATSILVGLNGTELPLVAEDGQAKLIANGDLLGQEATIVLLSATGTVLAQLVTRVGG